METKNITTLPPTTATPNVDLEKFVLSSMLLKNGAVVPAVQNILSADDFYHPENKILFNHIVNQYSQLARTDFLALVQQLKTSGDLQKIGAEAVFALPQWANTTAYSEYYSRIIKDIADKRRLNDITANILADTRAGLKSVEEIISESTDAFNKIQSAYDNDADLFGDDIQSFFTNNFQDYIEENQKYADRKTGFFNLDAQIYNFKPGTYILGGVPAVGKTTFALQLLYQMAQNGETCIYCSYEMEKGFLFSKLLAMETARIETENFIKHEVNGFFDISRALTAAQISQKRFFGHEDAYRAALKKFLDKKTTLYIKEYNTPDIDKLIADLEKICAKLDKPPIVCIDYLQLFASYADNTKTALDSVLNKLTTFRRNTNTTFIIISSVNRSNYHYSISLESFKETGAIEYSADVIWGLQLFIIDQFKDGAGIQKLRAENREAFKQTPREIQLKCLKNRFGALFDIYFKYYPQIDYFEPTNEEEFEEVDVPFDDTKSNNSNAKADE